MTTLAIMGYGYTAKVFHHRVRAAFDRVIVTRRSLEKIAAIQDDGVEPYVFDNAGAGFLDPAFTAALKTADALLVSASPNALGDPTLQAFASLIQRAPRLAWIGYLSTIGVYGDHGGRWINETAPLRPSSPRTQTRVDVEEAWCELGRQTGKAVRIFRLSGIYGPGRNALLNMLRGTARRIVKPGQVFNRIHVEDIAAALAASWRGLGSAQILNVTDDEPAPPGDVVAHAAALLGVLPPAETGFDEATLSPMAREFYKDNKRVSNRLLKQDLRLSFQYPTYREGLAALRASDPALRA